jgi:hypothetical protein
MSQSLVRFVVNFSNYIVNIHLNIKKRWGTEWDYLFITLDTIKNPKASNSHGGDAPVVTL